MFEIKKAVRVQQPALIGIWGGSYTGKTYSALRLARGLVGPVGKIGVIDTENRRALFNAGKVGGEWDHIDFQPPFTPERYIEAFRAFEHAGGYGCIVIDSVSHVWEGEGGVLDQADANNAPGLAKWAKPKMAMKRMINTLLRSPCHVIFCMRAKMGVAQEGRGKDARIISTGLEPIMEKNLIYEMLVSILIGPDHKPLFNSFGDRYWVNPIIPAIKGPDDVLRVIKPGEYLTEQTGEALRAWLSGASRDVLDEAKRVAGRGTEAFRGWWVGLSKEDMKSITPNINELKAICHAADTADQEAKQMESLEPANNEAEPEADSVGQTLNDDPFVEPAQALTQTQTANPTPNPDPFPPAQPPAQPPASTQALPQSRTRARARMTME